MKRILVAAAVIHIAIAAPAVAWASPDEASQDDTKEAAAGLENQPKGEQDAPPVPFTDPVFGPRYTIERIVVRGNRKTESALILGELGLRVGDQLTASDSRVETARIRLLALGFFLDARLGLGKGTGRGGAVLFIDVEERGTVILNAIYLGSSAATAFWGGLDVAENNLLGRGISLGTGFVASTRPNVAEGNSDLGARIRTAVPPLGETGLVISGTGLLVSGSEFFRVSGADDDAAPGNFVALRLRRVGGVVGLGQALTQSTRLFLDFREEGVSAELPLQTTRTSTTGVVTPLSFAVRPQFSLVGSVTATVDFDTRSDPLVPRAGTHVALSAEGASDGLLSSYQFLKFVLQGSFYKAARRGHIVGLHLFGGAIFGSAPLFDRFFVADLNLFLPPRAMGMNFSTQPSRDLLGTSISGHRYDNFAGRILGEYAVPLWRRRNRLVYSGDAFVAVGAFVMGSSGAFRDATRSGLSSWPIDLTGDLGVRLDTTIGVFTLGFANALGRMPF
ncbi:MAG: hypothetical protein ABUS79_04430 [Pseudomonadota bacterium]